MSDDNGQQNTFKQQVRSVFDRAAATYDQVGARFFTHFGERLVEAARLTPGATVLDVACGRGAVVFPAAQAVGPAGQVVGVDLSAGMVAATSAEVAARGISNVELRQMDAEALAFPDAAFDGVLCGFAIFFLLPAFDPGIAEMRRVLRHGGRLAVSTWVDVWGPEGAWLEPLQAEFLPPPRLPAYTGTGAPPVFDTPEGLTATLTAAGFVDVQIVAERVRFTYADEEAWWASLWSHGMRGWLEAVERQQGPAALQRFKERAFAKLRDNREADGFPQTSSALFGVATKP